MGGRRAWRSRHRARRRRRAAFCRGAGEYGERFHLARSRSGTRNGPILAFAMWPATTKAPEMFHPSSESLAGQPHPQPRAPPTASAKEPASPARAQGGEKEEASRTGGRRHLQRGRGVLHAQAEHHPPRVGRRAPVRRGDARLHLRLPVAAPQPRRPPARPAQQRDDPDGGRPERHAAGRRARELELLDARARPCRASTRRCRRRRRRWCAPRTSSTPTPPASGRSRTRGSSRAPSRGRTPRAGRALERSSSPRSCTCACRAAAPDRSACGSSRRAASASSAAASK